MGIAAHVAIGLLGAAVVIWVAVSAAITFVVPRGNQVALTRAVFVVLALAFRGIALRSRSYESRDRIMAFYAPFALLSLPIAWLVLAYFGFVMIYAALGVAPVHQALLESSSSLFTLGSVAAGDLPAAAVNAIEAGLGLGLVAILISYLPSIYSSYSRRETKVTGLDAYAGSPPFVGTMLRRLAIIERLDHTEELWHGWAEWFSDIEETHTSIPALVFFRSPQPERSWVTAAGTILDAASIVASSVTSEHHPEAQLCIRTGYLSLRRICDFYGLDYDDDPSPSDPISISREEYDAVFDDLAAAGAPMVADREAAWASFHGWRVNYDQALLELATLTIAAPAPWSSDRARAPVALSGFGRRTRRLGRNA